MVHYEDSQDSIFIECNCYTHGIKLTKGEIVDDVYEYYISFFVNNYMAKQDKTFWNKLKFKLKYIWYILIGKDYILDEISLDEYDFKKLRDGINTLADKKIKY